MKFAEKNEMAGVKRGLSGDKLPGIVVISILLCSFVCVVYGNGDANEPNEVRRPLHDHRAFKQMSGPREKMVEGQIRRRGVEDANVVRAMGMVPRHAFVSEAYVRRAYDDRPLPIGFGQTISQPFIVAYMTEALGLGERDRVLEIGTGSGYQAAVAGEIAWEVYSIEIVEELAERAGKLLGELGYVNVKTKHGDGFYGWEEHGPFDTIIVTAAAGYVPPALMEQLGEGGRLIIPLGSPYGAQTLVLIEKDAEGKVTSRSLLPVRFVPMVGAVEGKREEAEK